MISQADVIHSHVNSVEPIKVNPIDMFFKSIAKRTQITIDKSIEKEKEMKRMVFEAYLLKPKFDKFMDEKQQIHGNMKSWSKETWEKLEDEFLKEVYKNE